MITKAKNAFFNDRNTTIVGLSMLLVALGTAGAALFDGDPNTQANWAILVPELLAAIGLIVAGDGGSI